MISPFPERQTLLNHEPPELPARATSETVTNLLNRVKQQIVRHPTQSLLVALSAGVALGWITKRR